ncbi:hypothetical protein [Mesorhizobium sp. M1216]|uniref:hypothetical protein n=1 Tax=Mesorhizobium sp. M1216 TaxID=2957069 RepID=UPI00333DAE85
MPKGCRCEGTDGENAHPAAAGLVLLRHRQNLVIECSNLLLGIANLTDEALERVAGNRRDAIIEGDQIHQFPSLGSSLGPNDTKI